MLLTTPFSRTSTAREVLDGVDLTGRRAIVTGGSSGIGVETARGLALAGAEVTITARDQAAGERTADDIRASLASEGSGGSILVSPLDLTDRASIAAFVSAWQGPLHILVNNAGVMASPLIRTPEGWELQFATNHLGHLALTLGLHPALAAADGARVVSVSSRGHHRSPIVFQDIHFHDRPYDRWSAYGQSKTANILFAVEASRLWADDGIAVNSLMPGGIHTNLARYLSQDDMDAMVARAGDDMFWKSVEQGAATSALLAASPLVDGVAGRYFEDCNEAGPDQPGRNDGVKSYALDPETAQRLWQVSLDTLAQ
jgi:NAD(P)-dependent dehydrogenase (short-subunit alcohol dehydrogenase family)